MPNLFVVQVMNKSLDFKGERKQNEKEGRKQEKEEVEEVEVAKFEWSGEDGIDEGMNVFLR